MLDDLLLDFPSLEILPEENSLVLAEEKFVVGSFSMVFLKDSIELI
jgi:hypothetical protein